MKNAGLRIFSICVDVCKIYEGNDLNEIYEILSTLNNKKLKINNILIEKFKDLIENPAFEQDYW